MIRIDLGVGLFFSICALILFGLLIFERDTPPAATYIATSMLMIATVGWVVWLLNRVGSQKLD